MRRLKIMGATLAPLLLVAFVSSPAAMALPDYSTSSTFTGTSGTSTLETTTSGTGIACEKDKNSGTVTGKSSGGTFTVHFENCKAGAAPCNSEGDTKGIILATGTTTLGYISKVAKTVGELLKPANVKISCGEGALLVEVRGELICAIAPVNTDTVSYTQKCEKSAKGVQTFRKFEGSEQEEFLLVSFNGGTFGEAALVTEEKLANATLGEIKA